MALTAEQKQTLIQMIKRRIANDSQAVANYLVNNLLNDTQQETIYDLLRANIISDIDSKETELQSQIADLVSKKTLFPPRV